MYESNLIIYRNVLKNNSLIGGIVTSCEEGTGAGSGKVVNVKIKGVQYIKEAGKIVPATAEIAFWNNETDSNKNYADQILAKKIKPNTSFISTIAYIKDEKVYKKDGVITGVKYTCTGTRVKYDGVWKFSERVEEETGKVIPEKNIIIGRVLSIIDKGENVMASMSLYKNKEMGNTWHNCTFWKNDDDKRDLRADVKKYLSAREDGRKPYAIITCGKESVYGNDSSYPAFSFRTIDMPKRDSSSTSTPIEHETKTAESEDVAEKKVENVVATPEYDEVDYEIENDIIEPESNGVEWDDPMALDSSAWDDGPF